MFKPIKGGSSIIIQGLDCQLPPEGYVYNRLTQKLEKREIICRSKKPAEQYWERETMPDWYLAEEKRVVRARNQKIPVIIPYSKEAVEYQQKNWDRRLNGCWYMKKGKAVYITGLHWMFVQWWKIDTGYPKMRAPDLDYFYFLQYTIDDPNCYGMLEVTRRRFGKSYRAGLFVFEYPSRSEEKQGGIQSKTGPDAKKFFGKTVIRPFKNLPDFFKPTYDTGQGQTPKTEIRFQETNTRGRQGQLTETEELNSLIDFGSSDEVAYDGQKLHRLVNDEAGKTKECNVYDRWTVQKFCLVDDADRIIGKALCTTTVEKLKNEKDGISTAFKSLWEDSDQGARDEMGQTASGLYRFFMSAMYGGDLDIYGDPDPVETTRKILAARARVQHNPRQLAKLITKQPLTIQEAFRSDGENCHFDSHKLNNRKDELQFENVTERGNLEWTNGERDTSVYWSPNPYGKWEKPIGWVFDVDQANQTTRSGNHFTPVNNIRFGIGVDPYDHDTTQNENKRSLAAAVTKQKHNPFNNEDPFIGAYVLLYHARPATAPLMYEDILKQCFWLSASQLFETQKPGIMNYFRNRGYGKFLVHLPGYVEPGIPSTPINKETACDLVEEMVYNHSDKLYFMRQIDDLLEFKIAESRVYDIAMATLWCEKSCENPKFKKKENETRRKVEDVYQTYKVPV